MCFLNVKCSWCSFSTPTACLILAVIKAHRDKGCVFNDAVICWNRRALRHHVSRTNTRCHVIHSHMSNYYEDQHARTSQRTAYLTNCIKPAVTIEWLTIKQRHLKLCVLQHNTLAFGAGFVSVFLVFFFPSRSGVNLQINKSCELLKTTVKGRCLYFLVAFGDVPQ